MLRLVTTAYRATGALKWPWTLGIGVVRSSAGTCTRLAPSRAGQRQLSAVHGNHPDAGTTVKWDLNTFVLTPLIEATYVTQNARANKQNPSRPIISGNRTPFAEAFRIREQWARFTQS
jgi:hypothetical protein